MPRLVSVVLGALWLVCAGLGCGGRGELVGHTFVRHDTSYDIGQLPAPWRRLDVGGQNDVAFEHPTTGAVVQVNASCAPELDIPLQALTNHLLIGFTERSVVTEGLRPFDGREALVSHLRAKLDGVPRELVLVVMKKDGCVYDLALVADPGPSFEQAREDYEPFVSAFHARGGR